MARHNNNQNFISKIFTGIGLGIIVLLTAFVFFKANEISELFYAFLESIVGFVPFVIVGVIIYCMGWYNSSKKHHNESDDYEAENEQLLSDNKKMARHLRQAITEIEEKDATIEELRKELRKYRDLHNMSQIADMSGGNDALTDSPSDLQSSAVQD